MEINFMGAKPLAEFYEELKEQRRHSGSGDIKTGHAIAPEVFARLREIIERVSVLDSLYSDHPSDQYVIRVVDIVTLAERVFGDETKSKAWLKRPNSSLSGQRPIDLLKDELGAAVVREMLEQIDHGIFA
jgi:putative toxin-antitoxin system antitoxin component (TIGR02293 family)